MSSTDKAAISAHVDANKSGLSGDSEAIRRARTNLALPLRDVSASAAFRTEYASVLAPILGNLIADARDEVAANSLRLAAELGTSQGLGLLDRGLTDKRVAVRLMAAFGYGRLMGTIGGGNRAILASQATAAVATLKSALANEKDAMVADGLLSSLDEIQSIPADKAREVGLEAMRTRAAAEMIEAAGSMARSKTAGLERVPSLLRATAALVSALSDQATSSVTGEAQREAGGLAGDCLAFIGRQLEATASTMSDADRAHLVLLASQSERVLQLATQRLGGTVSEFKLADQLTGAGDAEFKRDVAKVNAVLGATPFELKRFQ